MAKKRKIEYLDDGPCNNEKMVDRISIKTVDRIFNQQSRLLPPQIQTTGNWWLVSVMWVFPTIGVYRGTQKRWIIIETQFEWMIWGGSHIFGKHPCMYISLISVTISHNGLITFLIVNPMCTALDATRDQGFKFSIYFTRFKIHRIWNGMAIFSVSVFYWFLPCLK